MDKQKSPYCTVQDHIHMSRYDIHTCPKCGGSTQEPSFKTHIEAAHEAWRKRGIASASLNPILKAKPKSIEPHPAPRYDEVYFKGVEWLNSL